MWHAEDRHSCDARINAARIHALIAAALVALTSGARLVIVTAHSQSPRNALLPFRGRIDSDGQFNEHAAFASRCGRFRSRAAADVRAIGMHGQEEKEGLGAGG